MNVALINMPTVSIYRPSIGLALLQAGLRAREFICTTHYMNLVFASMVGKELLNEFLDRAPQQALAGEWLFSESLFGIDNLDAYRESLLSNRYFESEQQQAAFFDQILQVRRHVEPFLERCLSERNWGEYDVIGFTSVFEQNVASLSLAKRMKERWPHLFIIFGGANCEGIMGRTLLREFPFVDAVCSGEGDLSFMSFMERFRETKDLKRCRVQGILLQGEEEHEALLHSSDLSPPVHDMDSLPYPDYDEYFQQYESLGFMGGKTGPRFLFESSRGCWWGAKSQCKFCGLNGSTMSYRSKSADRALAELQYLHERYRTYTQKGIAVDNIIDMSYFRDFLPKLREMKLDLDMFYETKANLTREQVKLFRDAGFHIVQPGIESLITSVLQLMKKGVSMLQNVQLLKYTREFGLTTVWNYLYGFPGEDPKEYEKAVETVRAITHLEPPNGVGPIRLDRFSPYFDLASEHGIRNVRPWASNRMIYQTLSDEARMQIAYQFDFDYETPIDPNEYARALRHEVFQWRNEKDESEFFAVDKGEHLMLVDFRPFAGDDNLIVLTGLEKRLFQFCSQLRSRATILKFLQSEKIAHSEADVEAMLDWFVERKLMLTEKDIYLNLAIPVGHYTPRRQSIERLKGLVQARSEQPETVR